MMSRCHLQAQGPHSFYFLLVLISYILPGTSIWNSMPAPCLNYGRDFEVRIDYYWKRGCFQKSVSVSVLFGPVRATKKMVVSFFCLICFPVCGVYVYS